MKIRIIKFHKNNGGRMIEWDRIMTLEDACSILTLCNRAPIKNGKIAKDVARSIIIRCLSKGKTLTMNNSIGYYSFQLSIN